MDLDPLFERLRRALSPEYRLERELGKGGMGRVFLATDLTLNRPVAVKVLRPELATAPAAEAFTREAQIMAQVRHPNVVTIHHAPPGNEGLHYYIMEFVEGPTLEERLQRGGGRLSTSEAVKLGRDLLDGLESVHRFGIVHRDIKPSNVFLAQNPRLAKLADFGIAVPRDQRTDRSSLGTPAYMAPEQIAGDPLTPRTDLYLAAMVIYEALTGRHYETLAEDHSWSNVPRRVARALRRALRENPDERWSDARAFRHALWRTRAVRYVQRAAMLAIGGIVVGASAVILAALVPAGAKPGTISVALPAFEYVGPPEQRAIADSLVDALRVELRAHPDFRVTTSRQWLARWPFRGPALVIRGRVAVTNGDVSVQLSQAAMSEVTAPLGSWRTLRDSLTYRVMLAVWDTLSPLARSLPRGALPHTSLGLARFLHAEQLVAAGEWGNAYRAYAEAESTDPTCWLCSWRLSDVERWLGREHDPARLQRVRDHIDAFPPWYQNLIRAADLPLPQRLELLHTETREFRDFFLGYLQLGDELLHRGPLVGHPRAEAIPLFEQAALRRPDFAPAWEHLAWVDITEGDSAGATRALAALDTRTVGNDPFALAVRALVRVAFAFRFLPPEAARDTLQRVLGDPSVRGSGDLGAGPRMLAGFDNPRGAIAFGQVLASAPARDLQRSGLIAQILGSVAVGKPADALALARQLSEISPEREIRVFRADLEKTLSQLERADVSPSSPFFRTVARLRAASQAAQRGDVEGARWQLLWHEHSDLVGIPTGLPQTAEVDWAFGTEARWRAVNLPRGAGGGSCKAYRDIVRLWSDGEPLYRARADTARMRAQQVCP